MDLTTLADLKAWLNISSTTDDDLLARVITSVSGWVERYLNRSLASASYDEFYDGPGGKVLMLRNFPVTAVSLVSVDGVGIPPAPDVISPGWRLVRDSIVLSGFVFNRGLGNVEVAYTAGYAPNCWPLPGLPLPRFLWRPDLTGDYRNVGSAGAALNLTPAPGAPLGSFNQGWVISNPTGDESSVVRTANNIDLTDFGTVYSFIGKARFNTYLILLYGSIVIAFQGPNQPLFFTVFGPTVDNQQYNADFQGTMLLQEGIDYIIIWTYNNGAMHLYINGVEDTINIINIQYGGWPFSTVTNPPFGLWSGDSSAYPDGPAGAGSKILVEAIHKGIAYTPAQAQEITAVLGLPPSLGGVIPELEQAAIELCALSYQGRTRIGESSKALPGGMGTVAYLKDIPPAIMQMLNRYKRVVPM